MIKYSANKLIKKLDKLYVEQDYLDDSCKHFQAVKKWRLEMAKSDFTCCEFRYETRIPKLQYIDGYIAYFKNGDSPKAERYMKVSKCSIKDDKAFRTSAIELVKILLKENTPESKKALKDVIKGFDTYYKTINLKYDDIHFVAHFDKNGNKNNKISQLQFNNKKYDESIQVSFEQKIFNLFKEKATQLMEKEPLSQPENPRLNSKNKNKEFVDRYHIWLELRKVETEKIQSDNDREKTAKEKAQKKQKAQKELEWVKKLN